MFAKSTFARGIPRTIVYLTALYFALASTCWCSPPEQTVTLTQGVGGYSGCVSTWLNEAYELNYGNDTELYVRYDQNRNLDRVTLIYFDLAGKLPAGACVKSATLRLYQYNDHSMTDPDWLKVGAYRMMRNWAEGNGGQTGATWSYSYPNHTIPWMVPGARGVNTTATGDRHHTHHTTSPYIGIPDSVTTITRGARWVEWDVTPSVQWWTGKPDENFGIVLDWWHEGPWSYDTNSGANMYSEKYANTDYRPQLVIKYVIPTAEPVVNLRLTEMIYNYWASDPGILFSADSGQLLCSGTTQDTVWAENGCVTNYTLNSSFESQVAVKLQQGIAGVNRGQFRFGIFQESNNKYISLQAVGYGQQYYELSGICQASGNGEYHDGSYYWASYWDGVYPTYPALSPACYYFAQTPENEATTYIVWKLRYDKPNGMLYAYVNDVLVTYYSKVNLSTFRLAIAHTNDCNNVPTRVWTAFLDTEPPKPNPMTWASKPAASGTTSISMTAAAATDDTPPVQYYFTEISGKPGGTSSGWIASTQYADYGLSVNTQYGYKVQAADSCTTPNVGAASSVEHAYTLINTPSKCNIDQITATSLSMSAAGSLPNIGQGLSGTQFKAGAAWLGDWKVGEITDKAINLTPNTQYSCQVRARNGDGIATGWSPIATLVRTLAAEPTVLPYNPVSCHTIQANWGANGNPTGTYYYCLETTTGKSSGWITDTNWKLTGLQSGETYNFKVKARNADGKETDFVDLGNVQTEVTIGKAKQGQINKTVTLKNKVVTAVFKDIFFIEDDMPFGNPQGVAGIGVKLFSSGGQQQLPAVGMTINLMGQLTYNDPPFDQELIIRNATMINTGAMGIIRAYGANNKSLGGSTLGNQPGVYDDVLSTPPHLATGVNSIGLLVRAWGAVSDGGMGGVDYFWVDDGSNLRDGIGSGIRVSAEPLGGNVPALTNYCSVTGIMRCMTMKSGGSMVNIRVLWPRSIADIVTYNW